jgi:hypothetical protein
MRKRGLEDLKAEGLGKPEAVAAASGQLLWAGQKAAKITGAS